MGDADQDEIQFDWDRANIRHLARHRVKPEEAEQALRHDPFDLEYQIMGGEPRWTVPWPHRQTTHLGRRVDSTW